jgi:hypothetical protein
MTSNPTIMLSESKVQNWPFEEKPEPEEPVIAGLPPMSAEERLEHSRRAQEVRARMSAPGALGLSEKLEEKRLRYDIMDRYFTQEAALFDQVYLFQLPFRETNAPGSSLILIPDITRDRYNKDSPRGVILSAGAHAMSILRSNGMQVGDTVTFKSHSPWRVTVDWILGDPHYMFRLNVGDLCGCEELAANLMAKRTRYVVNDATGKYEVVNDFERLAPELPYPSDEA